MQIIKSDRELRLFKHLIDIHDTIPVGTYEINFHPMEGYSLVEVEDFKHEGKIYGETQLMIPKIIERYQLSERNFGTILGGKKGMGKSMFARILSEKLRECGVPTILVNGCTPNLVEFLGSIEQPVLVVFDEFEKRFTFGDDEEDTQSQFLSLFDGYRSNHHFYLITINDYHRLSPFFIGRTGRFYYDIKFDGLTIEEISEVLLDNLDEGMVTDSLLGLLYRVGVNYDQLGAIVNELRLGESIESIFEYLNLGLDLSEVDFDFIVNFKNGLTYTGVTSLSPINPDGGFYVDTTMKLPNSDGSVSLIDYDFRVRFYRECVDFVRDSLVLDLTNVIWDEYNTPAGDAEDTSDKSEVSIIYSQHDDVVSITLRPSNESRKYLSGSVLGSMI